MYESPFFDKVAGHRSAILLNKRLWHRCFNVNFVKFLRTLKKKNIPSVKSTTKVDYAAFPVSTLHPNKIFHFYLY